MNIQTTVDGRTQDAGLEVYLDTLGRLERLHRLLLDVVKDEFERLGLIDINSVQGLLLFNIGEQEVTAGELKSRGYYQGSNVSYNLKKLVETGYMHHEKCKVDRRAVRVRLTAKGREIRQVLSDLFARHAAEMEASATLGEGRWRKPTASCGPSSGSGPTGSGSFIRMFSQ